VEASFSSGRVIQGLRLTLSALANKADHTTKWEDLLKANFRSIGQIDKCQQIGSGGVAGGGAHHCLSRLIPPENQQIALALMNFDAKGLCVPNACTAADVDQVWSAILSNNSIPLFPVTKCDGFDYTRGRPGHVSCYPFWCCWRSVQ
jgi:hypothetical protein